MSDYKPNPGGSSGHDLGYYADLTALQTAHPTGTNGDYAVLGSTDTVWVWDGGTSAWVDTSVKPTVCTGAEINTGTDNTKLASPKAIADSNLAFTTDIPVKAIGSEINTGTDDAKFATSKAIADSNIAFLSDIPAVPVKASSSEINTGTDDAKFATSLAIASSNIKNFSKTREYSIGVTGSGADFICDGVADDVQWQLAINSLSSSDRLRILAGTYTFATTVTVNKPLIIEGLDRTSCLIESIGNYTLMDITAGGCVLRYLGFRCTAGQTVAYPLIDLTGSLIGTVINNCYFAGNIDIQLGSVSYTRITENFFAPATAPIGSTVALNINSAASLINTVFSHNSIVNKHRAYYQPSNAVNRGLVFSENYVAVSGIPFITEGLVTGSKIINNYFQTENTVGISMNYDHGSLASSDNVISGNRTGKQGGGTVTTAFDLYALKSCSITGNTFDDTIATDCIKLSNNSSALACTLNTVANNTTWSVPSGGITETGAADYNMFINNKAGTVTLVGANSVNGDSKLASFAPASGKVLTVSKTMTLTSSDDTSNITMPAGTKTLLATDGNAASATKSTNLIGGNGTTLLGSIPYQSGTDATTLLSPNITVTKKFLRETGDGTNGTAPAWDTLIASDVPDISATYVPKSLYDAYSIVMATTDDTPIAITIAEQQVVGRITGGAIKGLSTAEMKTLLGYAVPADVTYIGTTSVALNRGSAALVLTGITSIDGTAAKATNMVGGNNTTLLGSIGYQSDTDVTTLLSPNTTTTKKRLVQTGTGTNGAAPVWEDAPVKATGAELITATDDAKFATAKAINDSGAPSWSYVSPFTRVSDSSFTVTDNATNQEWFRLGRPIRYADSIGTWSYGIVTNYVTGTVTLSGAPMTTSFDGYLQCGHMTRAIQVDLFIGNTYGNGTDTDLLYNDMRTKLAWRHGKSYCVKFSAMEAGVDTGTEPKVNLLINGSRVSTTDSNLGIQLTTAGTVIENVATDINTSNYDVNKGEFITPECTAAGGTGDALDLTISATFIME